MEQKSRPIITLDFCSSSRWNFSMSQLSGIASTLNDAIHLAQVIGRGYEAVRPYLSTTRTASTYSIGRASRNDFASQSSRYSERERRRWQNLRNDARSQMSYRSSSYRTLPSYPSALFSDHSRPLNQMRGFSGFHARNLDRRRRRRFRRSKRSRRSKR